MRLTSPTTLSDKLLFEVECFRGVVMKSLNKSFLKLLKKTAKYLVLESANGVCFCVNLISFEFWPPFDSKHVSFESQSLRFKENMFSLSFLTLWSGFPKHVLIWEMVVCCPLIHWAGNERWENNRAGKSPIFISMGSQIVALSNSRIEEIIFDSEGENCPNSWALSLIFGFRWWPSFSTQLTENYSTAMCYSGVWQLWWKGPKVASQSSRPFQNCAVNH